MNRGSCFGCSCCPAESHWRSHCAQRGSWPAQSCPQPERSLPSEPSPRDSGLLLSIIRLLVPKNRCILSITSFSNAYNPSDSDLTAERLLFGWTPPGDLTPRLVTVQIGSKLRNIVDRAKIYRFSKHFRHLPCRFDAKRTTNHRKTSGDFPSPFSVGPLVLSLNETLLCNKKKTMCQSNPKQRKAAREKSKKRSAPRGDRTLDLSLTTEANAATTEL